MGTIGESDLQSVLSFEEAAMVWPFSTWESLSAHASQAAATCKYLSTEDRFDSKTKTKALECFENLMQVRVAIDQYRFAGVIDINHMSAEEAGLQNDVIQDYRSGMGALSFVVADYQRAIDTHSDQASIFQSLIRQMHLIGVEDYLSGECVAE